MATQVATAGVGAPMGGGGAAATTAVAVEAVGRAGELRPGVFDGKY